MRGFEYVRATDVAGAVAMATADPGASYLAGGTTLVDLMLKDGVVAPTMVIDVSRLPLRGTQLVGDALRVGAMTTMEELAADPTVASRVPFVREALLLSASTQLRNMARIGGNLLQRTRCRYFRDAAVAQCNKRIPGSGCGAVAGVARMHAILGANEHCIAVHASDLCVPLVAVDAVVHIQGRRGGRSVALTDLHVPPRDRPDIETVLEHGELITHVDVPLLPVGARSTYLKVRDRASYEFALTSAAAALVMKGTIMTHVRLGLGGVATLPWRARAAEALLEGAPADRRAFRAAADAELATPYTVDGTRFKVELAKRTIVRALETVTGVSS
jgi:CO/xanthine dehydrogenase FAD-binding subunit